MLLETHQNHDSVYAGHWPKCYQSLNRWLFMEENENHLKRKVLPKLEHMYNKINIFDSREPRLGCNLTVYKSRNNTVQREVLNFRVKASSKICSLDGSKNVLANLKIFYSLPKYTKFPLLYLHDPCQMLQI